MLQHLSVGRGRDPPTLACSTRETSASSSMVPWSLCYGVNMGEKLSLSADHAFFDNSQNSPVPFLAFLSEPSYPVSFANIRCA